MTEALDRLREAMAATTPPTPFAGVGLSSAATSGAATASWRGLLLDGIELCERVGSSLRPGWADRTKDQLDNADVITYLAVADEVTRRLRAVRGSREFDSWIQRTVGELRPTPEGRQIIEAVRGLGTVIVTTNDDTLIEDLPPKWKSYTWTDPDYGAADRQTKVVLHLHGVASKPESIILSSADYQRLNQEQLTQVLDKSLFASHRFIFIGCGDGLNDPNIAPLMEFVNSVMPQNKTEHFILVRGDQLRQLNERPLSPLVSPVAYGSDFKDLMPFLQKLAARAEIQVSQDPRYYEQRNSARPRTALLDLAGQAQEKLQGALDALHLADRAMRKVEQHSAMPAGMSYWDYPDQEAVHEELATSLTDPAAHFESCSAQVIPVFEDAEADVWKLTAPKFAKHAARLARVTERVSELADVSGQLLERVMRARDDLHARTDVCANYRMPYEALSHAYTSIDQALSIAISLREGLGRPQAVQATGKQNPHDQGSGDRMRMRSPPSKEGAQSPTSSAAQTRSSPRKAGLQSLISGASRCCRKSQPVSPCWLRRRASGTIWRCQPSMSVETRFSCWR